MAIVHQYDKDGFYLGPVDDYGGPRPHGCAGEAPPETLPDGSAVPEFKCFRRLGSGEFELIEDYRGQTGFDVESGFPVEIKDHGPWPDNLARAPKPGWAYEWLDGQWKYNIELDQPGPGYVFNKAAAAWRKTRYSVFSFLNLFTLEERAAVKKAIAEGDFEVAAIYDSFISADYIDLRNQVTVNNVWHLAAMNLLAYNQRAEEILQGQLVQQVPA